MYELTTGEYTVVFKLYFPSASIDHSSIDISATSSSQTVSRTSTNLFSDHSRSRMELQHTPADLTMSNKIIINLATPTNDNDPKNNSCVDGVKQAATLGYVPVYFFNYGMGYHNKKETKFSRQDQNMEFPMNNISQYEVKSDGTCEFHFRDGYRMPATHFYYKGYDNFGSILNRCK